MATEFIMPKLGLTMEEGTITEWFADDGDTVAAGAALLRIETDAYRAERDAFATCRSVDPQARSFLDQVGPIAREDVARWRMGQDRGADGKSGAILHHARGAFGVICRSRERSQGAVRRRRPLLQPERIAQQRLQLPPCRRIADCRLLEPL